MVKNIENVYEKSTKKPAAGEKFEKFTIILGKKHKYCVKKYENTFWIWGKNLGPTLFCQKVRKYFLDLTRKRTHPRVEGRIIVYLK